jgi:hypothetical protein
MIESVIIDSFSLRLVHHYLIKRAGPENKLPRHLQKWDERGFDRPTLLWIGQVSGIFTGTEFSSVCALGATRNSTKLKFNQLRDLYYFHLQNDDPTCSC